MTSHRSNRSAVERRIRQGIRSNLFDAATIYHGAMVEHLNRPGSGRTYRHGGVRHQASAPGEPPAANTGYLRESASFDVQDTQARVGVTAEYGLYLERGTRRMEPRPFVKPSGQSVRYALRRALGRSVT